MQRRTHFSRDFGARSGGLVKENSLLRVFSHARYRRPIEPELLI